MTDPTEAIRKALEALRYRAYSFGFEVGKSGKTVDSVTWSNKVDQSIEEIEEHIRALLDRLDSAERDAGRYRWLRGNVGEISTSAFEDMQFYGEPGDTQDALRLDAAIDAALRAGEQKEPK